MKRLAAAACLLFAPVAIGADWGVTQLFGMLAKDRPGRATFHERRFVSLLDRPLESSGELAFTPPDTMEKRTVAPRPERVTVDRDRLTIEREGKRRSLGLRENPAVAVLVDGVRATLAGDLDALVRAYSAALDGSAARWRLTLRPLDPTAAGLVERIDISGAQARVQTVEIVQADGDRSVMTITPVAP
jgi:outer membrane lipoprotein carrier protein LolA